MKTRRARRSGPVTVVIVGLGNIGSHVVDHVGRLDGVTRVVLVDRDVYEPGNVGSQKISPRDVGRTKAAAQASRLRRLNPALEVCPLVADVADVPMERLRANVIIAGLDSLEARLRLNEIAWRLGVPWVDGGIEPAQGLVRVNGYQPGAGTPCFACALHDADYENLAMLHPCRAAATDAPPTNGPPILGAMTAAMLALECEKILAGDFARVLFGRQVVMDVVNHRHYVTSFRRNPLCRFDHEVWRVDPTCRMNQTATLADLLREARRMVGGDPKATVRFEGRPLARAAHCPHCGCGVARLHVLGRIRLRCPRCRRPEMRAAGFEIVDAIDQRSPAPVLGRTLRSVGLQSGDVLTVHATSVMRRIVIT